MSTPQEQQPLTYIRSALADIAPEIPAAEIVDDADLTADLRLDTVSIWALAVQLEKDAHVRLNDADIAACQTVGDLSHLIEPTTDTPDDEPQETLQGAMEDLAQLWNS